MTTLPDFRNPLTINEFKKNKTLIQLKEICVNLNIHTSGTKSVLVDRISLVYLKNIAATILQKVFRGQLVRRCQMKCRGRHRVDNIFVNDCDFYTLEPINNIPINELYFYSEPGKCTDEISIFSRSFHYAFHIPSLFFLLEKTSKLLEIANPYTRHIMPKNIALEIVEILNMSRVLFPNLDISLSKLQKYSKPPIDLQAQTELLLQEKRNLSLNSRIVGLFIDIDILGNYTSCTWFQNLSQGQTIQYWRILYEFWRFRGNILPDVKKLICPYYCPFKTMNLQHDFGRLPPNHEEAQLYCLYAMENLLYMSPEIQYRKLAAMYILTALVRCSPETQRAIPWLS